MDPKTVVIMLAANLIGSGGLFYLIGRRMPARSGVMQWAAGSMLFGAGYVARLVGGPLLGPLGDRVVDTGMVVGALLLLAGLRQWVGGSTLQWPWLLGWALGYGLAQWLVVSIWAAPGRFMLHNLSLALVYALFAAGSARALRHPAGALRLPLLVSTLLIRGLALLTALRGLNIARDGTGSLSSGLAAQIYYGYASLAVVLLALNLLWMVFVRLNEQLLDLASRDALTHVLNRNGLDDALARHFAARGAAPVTLLEVDIDHFKRISDNFGHATGDLVLRHVADTLARHVRGNDFVARMGGEEFLVGCVGSDRGCRAQPGRAAARRRGRAANAGRRGPGAGELHGERGRVPRVRLAGRSRAGHARSRPRALRRQVGRP